MTVDQKIVKAISRRARSAREIAEHVGTTYDMVRKVLTRLRAEGRLDTDTTLGGYPKVYKIRKEG